MKKPGIFRLSNYSLALVILAIVSAVSSAQETPKRSSTAKNKAAAASKPSTKKPTISAGKSKNTPTEPLSKLDQMFVDAWKEAGTAQAAMATDAEFVRRVYLDTIGRVPTVEEARAALAMNLSTRKGRRQLVESLLEHPDYPRNFALILRNALIGRNPMGGRDVDAPAFETWLRQQILQNVAWDKMVREMLAGEGASNENGAVNYILSWARFGGSSLADENAATALTGKTTRAFLGLQIQCTQCHDHFLNSTWKQNDFWGINAFFLGMQREEVAQNDLEGNDNNRQRHYILNISRRRPGACSSGGMPPAPACHRFISAVLRCRISKKSRGEMRWPTTSSIKIAARWPGPL